MKTTLLAFTAVTAGAAAIAVPGMSSVAHAGVELGGQFQLLPVGEFHLETGPLETDVDTETAFALQGQVGGSVHPNISFAFAPRLIFNVKGEDSRSDDSATQLDFAVRGTFHGPVTPTVDLYGFLAPGFSVIFVPDNEDGDNPSGLVIGLGGGAAFELNARTSIIGELGYTIGNQGVSQNDVDAEFSTSFLHFGIGVLTEL